MVAYGRWSLARSGRYERVDCNKIAIKCRPKKVTVNKNIIVIWYSFKVNLTAEEYMNEKRIKVHLSGLP